MLRWDPLCRPRRLLLSAPPPDLTGPALCPPEPLPLPRLPDPQLPAALLDLPLPALPRPPLDPPLPRPLRDRRLAPELPCWLDRQPRGVRLASDLPER